MDWKQKSFNKIRAPKKFWDVMKPSDARLFLRDLRHGPNSEPVNAIKFEDGREVLLEQMTDDESVQAANAIVDVIQKHQLKINKVPAPSEGTSEQKA